MKRVKVLAISLFVMVSGVLVATLAASCGHTTTVVVLATPEFEPRFLKSVGVRVYSGSLDVVESNLDEEVRLAPGVPYTVRDWSAHINFDVVPHSAYGAPRVYAAGGANDGGRRNLTMQNRRRYDIGVSVKPTTLVMTSDGLASYQYRVDSSDPLRNDPMVIAISHVALVDYSDNSSRAYPPTYAMALPHSLCGVRFEIRGGTLCVVPEDGVEAYVGGLAASDDVIADPLFQPGPSMIAKENPVDCVEIACHLVWAMTDVPLPASYERIPPGQIAFGEIFVVTGKNKDGYFAIQCYPHYDLNDTESAPEERGSRYSFTVIMERNERPWLHEWRLLKKMDIPIERVWEAHLNSYR